MKLESCLITKKRKTAYLEDAMRGKRYNFPRIVLQVNIEGKRTGLKKVLKLTKLSKVNMHTGFPSTSKLRCNKRNMMENLRWTPALESFLLLVI